MTDAAMEILLIEDDEDDALLIRSYLREALDRPRVEHVPSAGEGLERVGAKLYDVLLVDYRLGPDDGLTMLRQIRASGVRTPAIVLTGRGDQEVAVEAMKSGASDYLPKAKLKAASLGTAVRHALELHEARRQHEQAVQALRESEERYRRIVETAQEGIWVLDADGRTSYVNRCMAEMLGAPLEELHGRSVFDFVAPEDRDSMAAHWQKRRQGLRERFELHLRRTDGRDLWVLVSASPVLGADGTFLGSLGMLTDVTESKRLEEELRQAQKMEAIGRLAGGIAHDFNNLLTAVLGYCYLGLASARQGDPLRMNFDEIRKAGERAAGLTRQLLAYGRRQMLTPRPLDLSALVGAFEGMLQRLIGEDIELRTVLEPSPGVVHADATQIEQVLLNLCINARDAMPNGGKLTLETRNVLLDEGYVDAHPGVPPGAYVLLAVSDTGTGMTPDVQAHMFEPFFTTKEPGKGTGLGLATVYGIVKQSGGHLSFYSEPGHGSVFRVYLPRIDEEAPTVPAQHQDEAALHGSATVLLVEDDARVRKLAGDVLELYGYRVLPAEDGDEALQILRTVEQPPDLLLTDVVLRGMNGREVAQRVCRERPGIRVLYMSGYTDNAIVHHGVLAEGIAFIQKPFTPKALARKVRDVLAAGVP